MKINKAFPFFKQHDSMECGVACLRMICEFYGKHYSSNYLSDICMCTTEGVSLLAISRACQQIGIHSVCGKLALYDLNNAVLPCILFWNQNHFVVLYKIMKDKYYIADPKSGLTVYTADEMRKYWVTTQSRGEEIGVALFLEPMPDFYSKETNNSATHTKRSFGFLIKYLLKYKRYFGQIVLGFFIGSLLQLALPFLTQSIVDVGIKYQNISFIWLVLIGQLMLTISRTVIDFVRSWLLLHINLRINISLLSDFFLKLLRLPMAFFDTKLLGDLMQRMHDHGRINTFLTQQTLTITFSVLTLLVFSVVLLSYNFLIFVIFLLGSLVYVLWMILFLQRRKVIDYELFELQAQNNNKTYEFITAMQEIKLQDCELRRRWEWEDVQTQKFQVQMKALKLQQMQEAGSILINETKNIVITVVTATAVIHGNITLGMMLAIQYIIGQLNTPVQQLMNFCYSLQDVRISLERINEIQEMKNEDADDNHQSFIKNESKGIHINNLVFRYDKYAAQNTLNKMAVHLPYGKVTAIVGASGSGKTTLMKLMLSYYQPIEGNISVGDTDISYLNKRWWRKQCGVVMQDGFIFSESIARNIAVDDEDIDKERLVKAAEIACIKDFILSLPLKFNTKIGKDGVGLSQGQKQRILIARAVYRNPRYIFLDEATNSLDANNERLIVENLNNFYKGKTVVVVAHRLSTVKNADQIIVLEHGNVIEKGTHDTLLYRRGAYYNLVKNQLELGN